MSGKGFEYHNGEDYKVISRTGDCGLVISGDDKESVEGCRRAIDKANARAVSLGYKAEQFAIVRRVWCSSRFPDGTFNEFSESNRFVELYPREL